VTSGLASANLLPTGSPLRAQREYFTTGTIALIDQVIAAVGQTDDVLPPGGNMGRGLY